MTNCKGQLNPSPMTMVGRRGGCWSYAEPSVGIREAQVMQAFTGMITHRANTAKESRTLIAEMGQRFKRVSDVTGTETDICHTRSVLTGIIDLEAL